MTPTLANSILSKKKQPMTFTDQYKKILRGVTVFVDTLNEDGSDASPANAEILRRMGAMVAPSFGEGVDMLIWSTYSTSKRFAAAAAFSIPVVSSLWIESCVEKNALADFGDFYFTNPGGGNSNGSNSFQTANSLPVMTETPSSDAAPRAPSASSQHRVVIREPQVNQVSGMRPIDSPFFSSSQRVEDEPPAKRKSALKGASIKRMEPVDEAASNEQETQVVDTAAAAATAPIAAIEGKRKQPIDLDAHAVEKKAKGVTRVATQSQSTEKAPAERLAEVAKYAGAGRASKQRSVGNGAECDDEAPKGKGKAPKEKAPRERAPVDKSPKEKAPKEKAGKALPQKSERAAEASALVIAVSGFDDAAREDGEKATVKNAAEEFVAFMNSSKGKATSSSSDASRVSATVVDTDSELNTDIALTHVIANSSSSKRSLRIIHAMARGTPIVTEEWLYACVEAEQWILGDVSPYCHSRYEDVPHDYHCQEIFSGKTFVIAETSNPPAAFMAAIIRTCKGEVVKAASDYVVFESQRNADEWTARKSAGAGAAVTNKYIFDCIERNTLLPLAPRFKPDAAKASRAALQVKALSHSSAAPSAAETVAAPAIGSDFIAMLAQVPGQVASYLTNGSSSNSSGKASAERKRKAPCHSSQDRNTAPSQEILSGVSGNNILSPISLTQISGGGAGQIVDKLPTPKLSAVKNASSKKGGKTASSIRFGGDDDDDEAVWDENDDIPINRRSSAGGNSSALLDTSRVTEATALVDEEDSFQYNVDTYNDDF